MKTATDGALPSDNAMTVAVLLRLFSFTEEERYYGPSGFCERILDSKVFETGAALLIQLMASGVDGNCHS